MSSSDDQGDSMNEIEVSRLDEIKNLHGEIASEYRAEIETRYGKPIGDLSDEERRKVRPSFLNSGAAYRKRGMVESWTDGPGTSSRRAICWKSDLRL